MLPVPIQLALNTVTSLAGVRAVSIVGSRVPNYSNPEADDWDLEVYTNRAGEPDEEQRRSVWSATPPFDGARASVVGGMNDRFVLDGDHFGFSYYSVESVERRLDRLYEGSWDAAEWDVWPEAYAGKLTACRALWDPEGLVSGWTERLATYPAAFRLKAIQELVFEARGHLQCMRRGAELRDPTYFHLTLSDFTSHLLRLLFAVHPCGTEGPSGLFGS